jgi:hypothetical protein
MITYLQHSFLFWSTLLLLFLYYAYLITVYLIWIVLVLHGRGFRRRIKINSKPKTNSDVSIKNGSQKII